MFQSTSTPRTLTLLAFTFSMSAFGLACSEPVASDSTSPTLDSGVADTSAVDSAMPVLPAVEAPDAVAPTRAEAPGIPPVAQPTSPVVSAPAAVPPSLTHDTVRRAALARAVVDREPVDPTTEFQAGSERLYVFFEFANPADEELEILVRFERPNHTLSPPISLTIPPSSPRFRTWAYTRGVRREGAWAAVAETADGTEVARLPFVVSE